MAERQVIYSIQQIGLAFAVITNEAIELLGKVKFCFTDILVVQYGNVL